VRAELPTSFHEALAARIRMVSRAEA
jgi:hypothetical protein